MPDSAALALDLLVAQACETAKNKYATSHVNQAHGALIETALKNEPPAFGMFPPPASFEDARQYLERLARAFDEVAYQVAREAGANAPTNIDAPKTLFSDALHDSDLLGELSAAAERAAEDALEAAE
jgi:hypothetical protein